MTPRWARLRLAAPPRAHHGLVALGACLLLLAGVCSGAEVDWLLTARYVITMDAQRRVIEDGAVAVRENRIVAVGSRAELVANHQAKQRLDFPNGLLAPGLINTHTHAAMSLFRGLADDLRLQDWLEKYIFPAEAKTVTPEFVRWGTRLACLEMLQGGITTYADMYYFEEVVAEATREMGMRGVLGETIIDSPSPDAKTPEAAMEYTARFIEKYRNDDLVVPAVAPHAIYTNSKQTLQACRKLANRYSVPLLMHAAETRPERDEAMAKWSATPVQALDAWGVLSGRTLLAHGVWLNERDMEILRARGAGVAHCPSSNMKLSSGIAPVVRLLKAGIAVGLGTDGVAGSNNDLNLFEEMDLAAKLAKVSSGDPQALPAATVLELATIGGARALGLADRTGSLEPGKLADIVAVDLSQPHAQPLYDVVSQFVYALKASDVSMVMVDGKLRVKDGAWTGPDAGEILARSNEIAARVRQVVVPGRR